MSEIWKLQPKTNSVEKENVHNRISNDRLFPTWEENEQNFCSAQLLVTKDETNKINQIIKAEFNEKSEVQNNNMNVDATGIGRYTIDKIIDDFIGNGNRLHRVRWDGYSANEDTVESAEPFFNHVIQGHRQRRYSHTHSTSWAQSSQIKEKGKRERKVIDSVVDGRKKANPRQHLSQDKKDACATKRIPA